MKLKRTVRKNENFILAAGFILLLMLLLSVRYDFYFDLNDDVLMKDILSGAYTGTPESRNLQMLYPLSLLLSLCYRLFPAAPVYGFFLCLCQFGCLYLIVKRSLSFRKSTGSRLFLLLFEGVLLTGLFLSHLLFIQYTVTSALLAATAAFLFLTADRTLSPGAFFRENIVSIALAVTAFLLRTEMLLLLLPLICVAGVCRWAEERPVFTVQNAVKYLSVFAGVLIGMAVSLLADRAAYSGEDWKSFREFFDSRTELYDFQGIPSYEENRELYEELGIGESGQRMLFERYNFGMEDAVDARMLDALSACQAQVNEAVHPLSARLVQGLSNYFYRTFHREPPAGSADTDYPWNLMVILGYVVVFFTGIWNAAGSGEKLSSGALRIGWRLALLGMVRTALWLFILVRNRYPVRITHSLYLMETCILFGLLLTEYAGVEEKLVGRIKAAVVFPLFLCFSAFATVPGAVAQTEAEYEARELANETELAVKAYCRSHPENFYFRDVYSAVSETVPSGLTVPYSEKLFAGTDNRLCNYDLMGGWAVKSPLYEKKLARFSLPAMREALLSHDRVYLLALTADGTDWLTGYYEEQGTGITVERTGTIRDKVGVYRVSGVK